MSGHSERFLCGIEYLQSQNQKKNDQYKLVMLRWICVIA